MKPTDATELPIAADLSIASLLAAMELLGTEKPDFQVFRCASQSVPVALLILNGWNIPVEIDFSYGQDEWSLHASRWDREAGKRNTRSVWSPGA